jgi:two-component system cell cycle response regulator DivK
LKDIPVIAVTAFAMKGDEEKIMEGGCDGYIAKPISVPNFLETVSGFLG